MLRRARGPPTPARRTPPRVSPGTRLAAALHVPMRSSVLQLWLGALAALSRVTQLTGLMVMC